MYVYTKNFVHTDDGVFKAYELSEKKRVLGADILMLENGLELIVPNLVELEPGDEVVMMKPIKYGKYHEPEIAEIIGLLNGYGIASGNNFILFIPDISEKELLDLARVTASSKT